MKQQGAKTIALTKYRQTLTYRDAKGKTLEEIEIYQVDSEAYVVVEFSDDTEVSLELTNIPVVRISEKQVKDGNVKTLRASGIQVIPGADDTVAPAIRQKIEGKSAVRSSRPR